MFLSLLILALQALATAVPAPVARGELERQECYPGEVQTLFCYKKGQGTPQNVNLTDVAAAAQYMREWGTYMTEKLDDAGNPIVDDNGLSVEVPAYRYLNMNATTAPNCGEWTLYKFQSVLIAAKLMQRRENAFVWYSDVADAIDGGEFPTAAQKAAAIVSCGSDGGSKEANATLTHEAYKPYQIDFDTGTKSAANIVIKVVANIDWKKAQGS